MTWTDEVAVSLDPVDRARVLAAALPGAGCVEAVFDAPFEVAWTRLMDLERSVPAADSLVARLRVGSRRRDDDGVEHLVATAWAPFGLPTRFDVRIEDGFCLMRGRGRLFVVVMAARPEPGGGTRYCHVEAVPRRAARPLRPLLTRIVAHDVEGFGRVVEG